MNADKIVKNGADQIALAFKLGGVSAAVEAAQPYLAFREHVMDALVGKVPAIFIERIFGRV